MSVNKVQLANGETIIDISDSTVTPETLAEGVTAHDASGKKITGKMIPGGGSSVQSDWNQTDETAADFIKNKPFGEVPTVILEEQELTFDAEIGGGVGMTLAPIHVGDALTVLADGVGYECLAVAIGSYVVFGNLAFFEMGDDTGEPFAGMYADGMLMMVFMDEFNHTVQITGFQTMEISAKYIPAQTVFYCASGDVYIYTDDKCTTKATIADVQKAYGSGAATINLVNSGYVLQGSIVSVMTFDGVKCLLDTPMGKFYTSEYTPTT